MADNRFSYGVLGSNFKKQANFVSLRMQKLVPIFDVDLNELDDIRRYHTEQLWKLIFGDGPSILIRKEWNAKQGTFSGPGEANEYIPFFPHITPTDISLNAGDFYWQGYWIPVSSVSSLERNLEESQKEIEKIHNIYPEANTPSILPPVEKVSTVLQELPAGNQVCVVGIHAFKYLHVPEADASLKRPLDRPSDAMETASRFRLFWTYRFLLLNAFEKLYDAIEKRRKDFLQLYTKLKMASTDEQKENIQSKIDEESPCPLKFRGEPFQEMLLPLYAFQIRNRNIYAITDIQKNLEAFRESEGRNFTPKQFQNAYKQLGKFSKFDADKIYIQRLWELLRQPK
ncbi:MAG: hypothetical protein D6805_08160 [Planctomycetota bacterium]|nr:MAG: hypothetical protein D6805_08160 [Planctomycetota bacterium]